MAKVIIPARDFAEPEAIFDVLMMNATAALGRNLLKKSIPLDAVERVFYDTDIHNRFKELAYEAIKEIGYDIESDDTEF